MVPGDVILLEAGDKIPADARLLEAAALSVDESILTGESVPVEKFTAPLEGREKMIAALKRLQKAVHPQPLPDQMAAFGISGSAGSGIRKLFLTHPPLEERIEALTRR